MYINRTQPDFLRSGTKITPRRKNSGEHNSGSFASIIEMDVVEIGDSTDEKRREQPAYQQRQTSDDRSEQQERTPSASSIDIKV